MRQHSLDFPFGADPSAPGTALVPLDLPTEIQGLMGELDLLRDVRQMQKLTSFNLSDPAELRGWLEALDGDCEKPDRIKGACLEVEHFLVHFVRAKDDEEAEARIYPRMVLVSPLGRLLQVTGRPAVISMYRLQAVFGPLPWRPARMISVLTRAIGGNRLMWRLREGPLPSL